MVALESIVPNHIYIDRNNLRIVVKKGTLPSQNKADAVVGITQKRLTKYGPLEILPVHNGLLFQVEAGNGVWGIQRVTEEANEETVISFSPFDYRRGFHTRDKDGKVRFEKPKRMITVSYEGLYGSDDLLLQIKNEHRRDIRSKVELMLQRANLGQAKIDLDMVTQRNVETQATQNVRTRGAVAYTECVDSMLQEFTDTAIDYTETEGYRRETRFGTSSRDAFSGNEAGEAELLSFVTGLIFNESGQVQQENIIGFGLSFIRVRGRDGIVFRIDREKGGDVTHLVIESDNGVVPIELREPKGFRDLFGTRIMNEVFPALRRRIQDEKRDTTLRRIVENLELMDPPMLAACVSYDELLEIVKRSPQAVVSDEVQLEPNGSEFTEFTGERVEG